MPSPEKKNKCRERFPHQKVSTLTPFRTSSHNNKRPRNCLIHPGWHLWTRRQSPKQTQNSSTSCHYRAAYSRTGRHYYRGVLLNGRSLAPLSDEDNFMSDTVLESETFGTHPRCCLSLWTESYGGITFRRLTDKRGWNHHFTLFVILKSSQKSSTAYCA